MKKHHKERFYFIYTVYLFDKRLHKKTALLIQNIKDIYKIPKYLRLFSRFIISKRLKSMVKYQLGHSDFEVLRFLVERVEV